MFVPMPPLLIAAIGALAVFAVAVVVADHACQRRQAADAANKGLHDDDRKDANALKDKPELGTGDWVRSDAIGHALSYHPGQTTAPAPTTSSAQAAILVPVPVPFAPPKPLADPSAATGFVALEV
jgi:hypothetical protein